MLVLEIPFAYDACICDARRFTEEEKAHYSDWYKDYGFVGTGENRISLPYITWEDAPKRPVDGEFCGCSNRAWIITDAEVEYYTNLNATREAEKEEKEAAEKAKQEALAATRKAEEEKIRAQFSTWEIEKNGHNATHTMVINGENYKFCERDIFDFGVVINPLYDGNPGWVAMRENANAPLCWNKFVDGEGWVIVRPLTENELICHNAIRKLGVFADRNVRM